MNKIFFITLVAGVALAACTSQKKETVTDMVNPFFTEYTTPFQVPPFDEIRLEHYMPALDSGIVQQEAEIAAIVNNPEEPSFENTILAYDNSGELIRKVMSVSGPLNSAITDPDRQALAREMTPKMTRHRDNLALNPALFQRVKAVYDKRADLGLDAQQLRLVEKFYQDFERSGANLSAEDQTKLRALNEELSKLQLQFGENLLAESNKNFRLVIDNEADLAGLSEDVILRAADRDAMQQIIDREGGDFKLAPWDWWYYSEKLRKQKFNLDEGQIKPYFTLDNAVEGIFYTANELYGITFEKRGDIPLYHEEAVAYEVKEADGSHVGVLFMDFHPRDGKRVGAWCTGFRSSGYKNGEHVYPVVSMVMNFTRPAGDTPALLSFDEVSTLFHEFGHALHSLFADEPYNRTSRSVPRDFVELPSQIMENWAAEPEVMKVYAKHYQTGEAIPDSLIDKLQAAGTFDQGFITGEYIAASLLDMDYHTVTDPAITDVREFEKKSMEKYGLIPEILPRYRSTYFSHTFTGGYTAGYYVYLWAAVLDTDAFEAFKETGDLFNPEVAARFRTLLAKSGSDEGMNIYRQFRGKDPSIEPLLRKRGLSN